MVFSKHFLSTRYYPALIQEVDYTVQSCDDFLHLGNQVKTLRVASNTCNENHLRELNLSGLNNLTELIIGDQCFKYVKTVTIVNMPVLSTLTVGNHSFCTFDNVSSVFVREYESIFTLINCPQLQTLQIGDSFQKYGGCTLQSWICFSS